MLGHNEWTVKKFVVKFNLLNNGYDPCRGILNSVANYKDLIESMFKNWNLNKWKIKPNKQLTQVDCAYFSIQHELIYMHAH